MVEAWDGADEELEEWSEVPPREDVAEPADDASAEREGGCESPRTLAASLAASLGGYS